jgi:hypothetical protein
MRGRGWRATAPRFNNCGERVNPLCAFSRARARAAPSASGFDPAAPARSYRVGSGTTRSNPLAEGMPR